MADSNGPRRPNYGRPEWQQGWDANAAGENSYDRGIDRWSDRSGGQERRWDRPNDNDMSNGWDSYRGDNRGNTPNSYGSQHPNEHWNGRGGQDPNNQWNQGERWNTHDGHNSGNAYRDSRRANNDSDGNYRSQNRNSDGNYRAQNRDSDGNYRDAQTSPRSNSYSAENYARYEPPRAQWEEASYRPGAPNFQQGPRSSQQSRPPSFQQVPQRNAIIAGLLGIFLGAFGAHNFYTGRYKIAVVQLALTVLSSFALAFITGLWGIIEGLMYLLASTPYYEQDGWGRPLSR
ncbi:MAG: NINE protein [Actinomycetaceae bacterium]|nr:NINE protein [Actinomycetaceae bacterium]